MAVFNFACFYEYSKVCLCAHAVTFYPMYWWTRYPLETTKFWNLLNLFHPEAWMWTFLTFLLVTVALKVTSSLGTKLELNVCSYEVVHYQGQQVSLKSVLLSQARPVRLSI